MFKIGDTVILISEDYNAGVQNPVFYKGYGNIFGTVIEINPSPYAKVPVRVKWCNCLYIVESNGI